MRPSAGGKEGKNCGASFSQMFAHEWRYVVRYVILTENGDLKAGTMTIFRV